MYQIWYEYDEREYLYEKYDSEEEAVEVARKLRSEREPNFCYYIRRVQEVSF